MSGLVEDSEGLTAEVVTQITAVVNQSPHSGEMGLNLSSHVQPETAAEKEPDLSANYPIEPIDNESDLPSGNIPLRAEAETGPGNEQLQKEADATPQEVILKVVWEESREMEEKEQKGYVVIAIHIEDDQPEVQPDAAASGTEAVDCSTNVCDEAESVVTGGSEMPCEIEKVLTLETTEKSSEFESSVAEATAEGPADRCNADLPSQVNTGEALDSSGKDSAMSNDHPTSDSETTQQIPGEENLTAAPLQQSFETNVKLPEEPAEITDNEGADTTSVSPGMISTEESTCCETEFSPENVPIITPENLSVHNSEDEFKVAEFTITTPAVVLDQSLEFSPLQSQSSEPSSSDVESAATSDECKFNAGASTATNSETDQSELDEATAIEPPRGNVNGTTEVSRSASPEALEPKISEEEQSLVDQLETESAVIAGSSSTALVLSVAGIVAEYIGTSIYFVPNVSPDDEAMSGEPVEEFSNETFKTEESASLSADFGAEANVEESAASGAVEAFSNETFGNEEAVVSADAGAEASVSELAENTASSVMTEASSNECFKTEESALTGNSGAEASVSEKLEESAATALAEAIIAAEKLEESVLESKIAVHNIDSETLEYSASTSETATYVTALNVPASTLESLVANNDSKKQVEESCSAIHSVLSKYVDADDFHFHGAAAINYHDVAAIDYHGTAAIDYHGAAAIDYHGAAAIDYHRAAAIDYHRAAALDYHGAAAIIDYRSQNSDAAPARSLPVSVDETSDNTAADPNPERPKRKQPKKKKQKKAKEPRHSPFAGNYSQASHSQNAAYAEPRSSSSFSHRWSQHQDNAESDAERGSPNSNRGNFSHQPDSRYQYRRYNCPRCNRQWTMVSNGRAINCKSCQYPVRPYVDPDLSRVTNQVRVHGYFWCPQKSCGWEWNDWSSYVGYPQKCPKCDTITFALDQEVPPFFS